ncbi:MAG: PepSY domain-containing protein [Pseudomonadota bacterium]
MRVGWRSGVAACGIWMVLMPACAQQNPAMQNPAVTESTKSQAKTTTPPLPGANSFAEGQARKLLESQGYAEISPLVNDSQGIWRGTAMSGSRKFHVSVDYKGNVSATPE